MQTRRAFLNWLSHNDVTSTLEYDQIQFLDIHNKTYVIQLLHKLKLHSTTEIIPRIEDFERLEQQRYTILDKTGLTIAGVTPQVKKAMAFCNKTDPEKRKCTFQMHPDLPQYLVKSAFTWSREGIKSDEGIATHYFFIPSFLEIAPQELHLQGINALLLDLVNYATPFGYQELFEVVKNTTNMEEMELDNLLLDFLSHQTLYYRTILLS